MVETIENSMVLEPITAKELSVTEIQDIIPHRYPFLMVDRVTDHEPGKHIAGYKNISVNEQLFQGHFPGQPVFPGVLQIEALAQLGAILVSSMPENRGKIGLFLGIDNARFRKMVVPGDRLEMEVEMLKLRSSIGKFKGAAMVNGEAACEAEMMFAITDRQH